MNLFRNSLFHQLIVVYGSFLTEWEVIFHFSPSEMLGKLDIFLMIFKIHREKACWSYSLPEPMEVSVAQSAIALFFPQ